MTFPSEKFCLKWNDYQKNLVTSYQGLRKDSDFSDVTLVCEENQQVEAHRIILAACSPFFSTVLKRGKHSHPMIFIKGMKVKYLVAMMDFIYNGEVNIHQEDLDGFLIMAQELQVKGLACSEDDNLDAAEDLLTKPNKLIMISPKKEDYGQEKAKIDSILENTSIVQAKADKMPMADLQIKLDSLMETENNGEPGWKCTVCGKATKGRYA